MAWRFHTLAPLACDVQPDRRTGPTEVYVGGTACADLGAGRGRQPRTAGTVEFVTSHAARSRSTIRASIRHLRCASSELIRLF